MGYLADMGFATCYVITFALWGMSVAFVFVHASSHNRSTWFWVLVGSIPFIGPLIYLTYFYYVGAREVALRREHSRERKADLMFKPVNVEERLRQEAVVALMNYRDTEIEKLILTGHMMEAHEKIAFNIKIATKDKLTHILETMYFYDQVIDQYKFSQTLPEVLTRLWDSPAAQRDLACEGESGDQHAESE